MPAAVPRLAGSNVRKAGGTGARRVRTDESEERHERRGLPGTRRSRARGSPGGPQHRLRPGPASNRRRRPHRGESRRHSGRLAQRVRRPAHPLRGGVGRRVPAQRAQQAIAPRRPSGRRRQGCGVCRPPGAFRPCVPSLGAGRPHPQAPTRRGRRRHQHCHRHQLSRRLHRIGASREEPGSPRRRSTHRGRGGHGDRRGGDVDLVAGGAAAHPACAGAAPRAAGCRHALVPQGGHHRHRRHGPRHPLHPQRGSAVVGPHDEDGGCLCPHRSALPHGADVRRASGERAQTGGHDWLHRCGHPPHPGTRRGGSPLPGTLCSPR